MAILDTEKRPRGFRALSAFKSSGRRSIQRKDSPEDDSVEIPDYLTADTLPSIPSGKQLPQLPPLSNITRPEVPEPPPQSMRPSRNWAMDMDAMPVNTAPGPRPPPTDITAPAEVPRRPMRSSSRQMNHVPMNHPPRGDSHTATIPYAPKPIRPPSTAMVGRIPSDGSPPNVDGEGDEQTIASMPEPSNGDATPVAYQDPEGVNGTQIEEVDEERPDTATPFVPIDVPAVPAPLNDIHFHCYQDHRSMPLASNVWYPVPCMACHKHDREDRCRCVFCCLRICTSCFEILQRCQRRSLKELLDELQR